HVGRIKEAEPHLAWLKAYYANHPTWCVAELYGWAIFQALPGQPAVDELRRLSADHPDSVALLRMLSQRAHDVDDLETTRTAIGRAIELTPDDGPLLKAELIRRRVLNLKEKDHAGALRDAFDAYVIDGDHEATMRLLRILISMDGASLLRER